MRWAFEVVGEEWRRGAALWGVELPERWEVAKVLDRMREEQQRGERDGEWLARRDRRVEADDGRRVIIAKGGHSSSPRRTTPATGAVIELDSGRRGPGGKGSGERPSFIRRV